MELIGKQYEADKAKLEKIRLLLVISSRISHVLFRVHSVWSSAKITGKEISAEENKYDCNLTKKLRALWSVLKVTDHTSGRIKGSLKKKLTQNLALFFLYTNKKLV